MRFIGFERESSCIEAYNKMNNVLIDNRRIKVDFSQSVAHLWNRYKMQSRKGQQQKQPKDNRPKHRLGELVSTAICGNDILSSLLFVTSLTAIQAGIYAPIAQLLVVFTLWLYKGVYCEVLSALPMNGGSTKAAYIHQLHPNTYLPPT